MYDVCMPTVIAIGKLLFVVHTNDHGHPHVTAYFGSPKSYEAMAKVRISDGALIEARGFTKRALAKIRAKVKEERELFQEAWDETRPEK